MILGRISVDRFLILVWPWSSGAVGDHISVQGEHNGYMEDTAESTIYLVVVYTRGALLTLRG